MVIVVAASPEKLALHIRGEVEDEVTHGVEVPPRSFATLRSVGD